MKHGERARMRWLGRGIERGERDASQSSSASGAVAAAEVMSGVENRSAAT
jgi:hypothetical protein